MQGSRLVREMRLVSWPPSTTVWPPEYFTHLEPQFNKLRADCEHLLQLNQRAMLAKSEAAAGDRFSLRSGDYHRWSGASGSPISVILFAAF